MIFFQVSNLFLFIPRYTALLRKFRELFLIAPQSILVYFSEKIQSLSDIFWFHTIQSSNEDC